MSQLVRHQLWIVAAAAVIFFTNLGATALWDEDEPLYASCAREMMERGDWVVPMYNGVIFPDKPPLMFWLMISGYSLFGMTEFAVRFWSAVLGVGTAIISYHLGRLLFNARVGLWAGLITASTIIFTVSARAATVDTAMTFATAMAMLLFVAGGIAKQRRANDDREAAEPVNPTAGQYLPDSWLVFVLMYACIAVAVLGKGPIGLLVPAAAIGMFLLVMQRLQAPEIEPARSGGNRYVEIARSIGRVFGPRNFFRALWRMRPLTMVVVVLAVAGPWYVLVGLRTDGVWLADFFAKYNLRPFTQPFLGHSGPFWYYIPAILIGFFPWAVFLGPSLMESWRRIAGRHAWTVGYIFCACWLGVFVVFWSIVTTKLPHYVLPAYPALALLTAAFVDGWIADPAHVARGWIRNANITLIVVGIGMVIALPIISAFFLPGQWSLGLVGLILVAGGLLCWRFSERQRPMATMITFAVTSVAFITAIFGFVAMRVDRYQNAQSLIAEIRRADPGPVQMAGYNFLSESIVFYAHQPIPRYGNIEGLAEYLDESDAPYVFTTDKHEETFNERFPGEYRVLTRRPRFLRPGELIVLTRNSPSGVSRTANKSDEIRR